MADTQSKILSKYGIDIAQENIFKLYKIDSADISPQDLETKIQDTRKRWLTSINGANEKNAERDRARFEKADQYETILKDVKLRKEVFGFYHKNSEPTGGKTASKGASTKFAKEYFELVATTKKIKTSDVDFFFRYYQSERKNKKAILEMLGKEMKIIGLGSEGKYADEGDTADAEGRKKDESSPLIVNLFQEATVLKIRRAIEKFEEASQSKEICQRYPEIQNGLYEFLGIKDVEDAKRFTEIMSARGNEVYAIRQERGVEYVPLVDLFNILKGIGEYRDVVDNIPEFKLLLKYPNLTPYMFAFVEMKPTTVKGIVNVANRDYAFRDDTDFILNYYKPIRDNFGISDGGIGSILRKAEKKTRQNKVFQVIDEKLGRIRNMRKIPIAAEILHRLVYWPIYMVYFVFEIAKVVFTKLHHLVIPAFVILFGLESWLLPKYGVDNLLILHKVFFKNQWLSYLSDFFGTSGEYVLGTLLLSLVLIILLLAVYLLPPLFVSMFIAEFADDFNKRFDWIGIERTFREIFSLLKKKTQDQYTTQRKQFFRNKLSMAAMNIICLGIVFAAIFFAPIGFEKFRETTGYFQTEETVAYSEAPSYESDASDAETTGVSETPIKETMVITEDSGNIRSGPGTGYEIVMTAGRGDVFVATGSQETASNGRIWYEIYLDDEMTQTGWASQKIIGFQ